MEPARLSAAAIVAAAADLADRDGVGAVNMSAVARHVGVRTASLYGHVRDQAAVVAGVHALALAELADAVADATAGRAGRDAVRGLADAMRAYATAHPGRWAVLQLPAADDVRTGAAAARLAAFTTAVFRGYDLDEDDVVHATRMLGSAVNGFIALDRVGAFSGRTPDPAVTWDRMFAALDGTFTAWAGSRAGEDHR